VQTQLAADVEVPQLAPPIPPPEADTKQTMKQRVREFVRSGRSLAVLPRDESTDVVSQWRKIRNPFRTIFNYLVIQLCKLSPWMPPKRFLLRRLVGVKIGRKVGLAPMDFCPLLPELITIEDGAAIGWKAHIASHYFTQSRVIIGRVVIGRNALIGAFSAIGPGVSIGENAVVTACSMVTCDVPPGEVWGGVPARRIQKLSRLM
jgi:acetyltransferase-like isoleucine patch superfamily enzyme